MRIRYTPEPGFIGVTSFDYRITNPDGSSATATITIDVQADTFDVLDDHFEIVVGEPFEFRLFTNDELAGVGATYGITGSLPEGMTVTSDGVVFGMLTSESEGSVAVSVSSPLGVTGGSTLSWSARLPAPGDAWLSPAFTEPTDTDAERINQALGGLADWTTRFPLTAAALEERAEELGQ